jgi:hypothetical protein
VPPFRAQEIPAFAGMTDAAARSRHPGLDPGSMNTAARDTRTAAFEEQSSLRRCAPPMTAIIPF